ncbi:poly(A) RNA polymerase, mitochondrial-like [Amyelois transitella]|uniref:poly(A) RNA polymerase, mitochondrial-like n=1 Tax=Amyelois transitella TaxID=680683 RepID=UPI00298FA4D9|nr:poly(A) RNA polymerase, mitochondrial-like [Amyelois transitella]
MSLLFKNLLKRGKINYFRTFLRPSITHCKCLSVRKFSDSRKKFVSFDEIQAQRRDEARRSLVVQVNSESSFSELYGYCSQYASINGIHHYKNFAEEHFMLIEFSSEDCMKDVLRSCCSHQKEHEVMALPSPFLWFRARSGKKMKLTVPSDKSLVVKNGNEVINEDKLRAELMTCSSVSEQIQLLYDRTVLNDIGVRLRYMVARQLEVVFNSLYSNIVVLPFGSSVNGFGRIGCDLDLVLTNELTEEMLDPGKRLVYQEKKCSSGVRPWQRHLELVAELLELRVAGAARVQRILHARVPIVKCAHELAGLDCDLCYGNLSGVHMSCLLRALGALDARARPLALAVRRWAAAARLTAPTPGRCVTNFPLTLMVLFFLQQRPGGGAVLPPVSALISRAGKEDIRIAEDNVNCTFLRDMNKLPPECYGQSQADLGTLLLQFFEFYAQFDFSEKAISVIEGKPIRKPNSLPLYIVNPLETALNVSRNVSYEECERLKTEVRNAAWQLEAGLEGEKSDDWGLIGLLENKASRGLKRLLRVGNSHRLVSVKDLFNDNGESDQEEGFKSKLQRLTKKTDSDVENGVNEMKASLEKDSSKINKNKKVNFKNSQVASEVFRIRRNKMI